MTKLATVTCRVLGVLFVVAGVATFLFGEEEIFYHNLLHLLTGLAALVVGFGGGPAAARIFCLGFGIGYLTFGALGFVAGNPEADYMWDMRVLHLASAEHVFHLVLGAVIVVAGILTRPGGEGSRWRNATARTRARLSGASRTVVLSLVVAAVGVLTMALSGVDFTTTVPPGLIILLLPAGLVAFGRWRWTPIIATLAGLFIVVGYFPSGSAGALLDLTRFGPFLGLWLQLAASLVAVVAGVVACIQNYQRAPKTREGSRLVAERQS